MGIAAVAVIGLSGLGFSMMSKPGKTNDIPVQYQSDGVGPAKAAVSTAKAEAATTSASSSAPEGGFVASKQGKKYFPVNCKSAKTIKEENKVYFGTAADAENAGYEATKTCK